MSTTTNTEPETTDEPFEGTRRSRRAGVLSAKQRMKRTLRSVPEPVEDVTDELAPGRDANGFPVAAEGGYQPKRRKLLTRIGYYGPVVAGAPSTTRQVEILNPAPIASPMEFQGLLSGIETLSSTPATNDQFAAFRAGKVTSANVCTIGDVGVGKSTLMKCDYVLRPLVLKGRRVVVIDIKPFTGDSKFGEYTPVAAAIGVDPIRFIIADTTTSAAREGVTLNLLDPRLLQTQLVPGPTGMVQMVQQAAAVLNDNVELDRFEKKAIRVAVLHALQAAKDKGRAANILDVLEYLGDMDVPEYRGLSPAVKDHQELAGYGARILLERIPEEMPGLFDGDTSSNVALDKKATFFDFSQLPEDGPARSIGMMLANAWTIGAIRTSKESQQTNFCVDEGWFLVGGPMGAVIRSNSKLSRALGLSNVVNIHHVADIPADDPAISFIKEAGTLHLFRQARSDDAEQAASIAGLRTGASEYLMTLPQGHHFKKVGIDAETRVSHIRSSLEKKITETNYAMGVVAEQQSKEQGLVAA